MDRDEENREIPFTAMLNKVTAIFVLIALLVNLMGHFVIFQCNQLLLRHQMADMILAGSYTGRLEKINIAKNSTGRYLKFSEEPDEFYYHGYLYDLVAEISTRDTTTYICIQDKDEQSLNDHFVSFLQSHAAFQNTSKSKPIQALIQHLVSQALIQKTLILKQSAGLNISFPAMASPLSSFFFQEISHHPEPCC